MAADNDKAARRVASETFSSPQEDGDREPVEAIANDTAASPPSRMAARRREHDERSVPASPPSSGIERDEERAEPSIVYPLPMETRGSCPGTAGNVRQASDRANGNLRTSATDSERNGDENDGQAISAAALLLLAASAPPRSAPSGAAGRDASTNDLPIRHTRPSSSSSSSSGSSKAAENAAEATGATAAAVDASHTPSQHVVEGHVAPTFSSLSGCSIARLRDTRATSPYPSSQPIPSFIDNNFFGAVSMGRGPGPEVGNRAEWTRGVGQERGAIFEGRGGYGAGGRAGASTGGYNNGDQMLPGEAQRRPSSLPHFLANGRLPPSQLYAGEEGRAGSLHSRDNSSTSSSSRFTSGSTTASGTPDQEPLPYHNYDRPLPSSRISRFNEFASESHDTAAFRNGGGGNGYGGPSMKLPQADRGVPYWHNDAQDNEQQENPSSFSTMMGSPLRVQPSWRQQGPTAPPPSSMPRMLHSPPRGSRSPSPPRTAGRKKPEGYRVPTWEGAAGRGWKTTKSGGSGGGGMSRRWAPPNPRGAGSGGGSAAGAGAGVSGRGRKVCGTAASLYSGKDGRGGTKSAARNGGSHDACWTGGGRDADGRVDLERAFSSVAGFQQQPQQRPVSERAREQGRTARCPRKRPSVAMDEPQENDDAADGQEQEQQQQQQQGRKKVLQQQQAAPAKGTVGRAQWRNGRAAVRAAGAAAAATGSTSSTGGSGPRPSKRHRVGGAQRTSTSRSSKVIGSRRPLAMDVDEDAPAGVVKSEISASAAAAATKGGSATTPTRPTSARKKSKSLVWSQFRKACDRCTDKKVRCDGSNPTGGFKACTPCKRAEVPCLFGICRRSGPRDAHGHKTASAGVIMKRKDFEKVTERFGQCRTESCRFVSEDGSFWKEHFHCRVDDCSFAGKTMSELLLHRGNDHPELAAGEVEAASSASAEEDGGSSFSATPDDVRLTSALVREVAAAGAPAVVPRGNGNASSNAGNSNKRARREVGTVF